MRSAVLSLTMVTALAVTPALAQTSGQSGLSQEGYPPQNDMSAGGTGAHPMGEMPAPPSHQPMSRRATNLNERDSRSVISPSLPSPGAGPNADATRYLQAAQNALSRHRTGAAQAALENAETYLLNRSVPQGMVNQPDQSPAVQTISGALQSLASGDRERTMQLIQQAMQQAQQAQMAIQSGMPMQPGMGMQPGMNGPQAGMSGYQPGMPPGQPGMGGAGGYPPGPGMQPGPGGYYPANAGMQPSVNPPAGAYPPGPGMQPGMGYPPPPPVR